MFGFENAERTDAGAEPEEAPEKSTPEKSGPEYPAEFVAEDVESAKRLDVAYKRDFVEARWHNPSKSEKDREILFGKKWGLDVFYKLEELSDAKIADLARDLDEGTPQEPPNITRLEPRKK